MSSEKFAHGAFCHTCDREFRSLGIARHRAMHRDKEQDCKISYADGSTYTFNYDKTRTEKPHGHTD